MRAFLLRRKPVLTGLPTLFFNLWMPPEVVFLCLSVRTLLFSDGIGYISRCEMARQVLSCHLMTVTLVIGGTLLMDLVVRSCRKERNGRR